MFQQQNLRNNMKNTTELKNKVIEANHLAEQSGKLDQYHVAKLDDNGNYIEVYKNRNQAVRDHFVRKGYSNTKSIIAKYVSYNGSLYNTMHDGRKWYRHYYQYISNTVPLTVEYSGVSADREFIVVSEKGEELEFKKKQHLLTNLGVPSFVISPYYLDSGNLLPCKPYSIYTKGRSMEFNSKKEAMKFYKIGKDKFKKLYEANQPIRGQQVTIKN
jgi:hypothetical protein